MRRGPAALLRSIPGLLGRAPRHRELLAYGWSLDYPEVAVLVAVSPEAEPWEQTKAVSQLVVDGAESAVFIAYGARPAAPPPAPIPADSPELSLHWLVASAHRYGINTADALIVSGDRWWSLGCTNPSCCPPEGTPIQEGPTP
jgi:Domain of unknown function (DUF4192)